MTFYVNNKVLQRRRSRKPYTCRQCRHQIDQGEEYYTINIGGGGLGSLKYPDRIHLKCVDAYFEKEKTKEGNRDSRDTSNDNP